MGLGRAPALRSLQSPHLGSQRSDLPGESNLAWKPLKEKRDIQRVGEGEPRDPPTLAVLRSELWQHPPKPGAWPTTPTQAQHLRAVLAARGPATRRDTVSQNLLPPQTRQHPCSVQGDAHATPKDALGGGQGFVPALFQPRLWVLEPGAGASRTVPVPGERQILTGSPGGPGSPGWPCQDRREDMRVWPTLPSPAAAVATAKIPPPASRPHAPALTSSISPVLQPRVPSTALGRPQPGQGPARCRRGRWGPRGDGPCPYLQSWPPHGPGLPFCSREALKEERAGGHCHCARHPLPPRVLLQRPAFLLGLLPWRGISEGGDFSLLLSHEHVPKQIGAGACDEAGWHSRPGAASR